MRPLRAAAALASLLITTQASPQHAYADTAAHRVLRIHTTPDVALEVLDWGGTGPALVFLSGFSFTGHVFDTFAPRFTDRFHVLSLTRRGLGRSDRPEGGPYDAPTLAADVKAVLDSLGIAKASLAGWSFGGTEASFFAAAYPDRIDRIVYLDSYCSGCGGVANNRGMRAYRPPDPPMAGRDTLTPGGMIAYQRRTMGYFIPEAELRLILNYNADGSLSSPVPPWVWEALQRGSGHPGYEKIHAPALGIFAERSTVQAEFWWARRMRPPERTLAQIYVDATTASRRAAREQFVREMPDARAETIEGAQHPIFLSHPDRTERLMRAFLLAPADSAR